MSQAISTDERILKGMRKALPNLNNVKYKGQDGRIGIFGGSTEYTGAPFFAAMSVLRTGGDVVHIFCTKESGTPIKSYSPEPIVHPILDQLDAIKHIRPWLDRLHIILIGPGLGRDDKIFKTIAELIAICREKKKPLVIDADGLFLLCQKPDIIKGYPNVILTPNAMEFSRLAKAYLDKNIQPAPVVKTEDIKQLAEAIGPNAIILHKGAKDVIADSQKGTDIISCGLAGSGRRCGGQGDLLSGAVSVFWWWALSTGNKESDVPPAILACYSASRLTRECNAAAYKLKFRSMLTTDMLEQIQPVFTRIFETLNNKSSTYRAQVRKRSSEISENMSR
ncbi:ATP-dependent (S)-NAD(P)H-hydrate dehydratase isoform X2 [Prorops nasuta]